MTKLSENIRILRKQNNMTLEELGKKIGVSKQTVQRYETGEIPNIPYDKILSLCEALYCTPQFIMGWENLNTTHKQGTKESKLLVSYNKLCKSHKKAVRQLIENLLECEENGNDDNEQ